MTSTIVTAFVTNKVFAYDIVRRYYEWGKLLVRSSTPKIIFVDQEMSDLITKDGYDQETTLLVPFERSEIYLYQYRDRLDRFNVSTPQPEKDNINFMFVMCHKTEWIRRAIELNPFQSDNFIWVDFGIKKVDHCSEELFVEKLNRLRDKKYDKVRIGSIWNLSANYNIDILRQISWYFAGGVFGGDTLSLLTFADLMKAKCIEIMEQENTITWEVNIWYLLYRDHPQLFTPYPSDHNHLLIDNY